MKAVILAAGLGTRMRPFTFTRPKHMLPVAGKPILEHVITKLHGSGFKDIIMVIGHQGEYIKDYFGDGTRFDLNIEYVTQERRLGLAHALTCAENYLDDDFLVYLGDVLSDIRLNPLLKFHRENEAQATLCLAKVEDPSKFGVAKMSENRITHLVEKPRIPPSNLAVAGIYVFDPVIFEVIETLEPSWRGEYEITDAVQGLVNRGELVLGYIIERWWKDTGHPFDLLEANMKFLSNISPDNKGDLDRDVIIEGNVVIEERAIVRSGTRIIGPSYISRNTDIGPNCTIGPYTYICPGTKISSSSVIANSIVLDNVIISDDVFLERSIVGEGSELASKVVAKGSNDEFGVVIGDFSVIGPMFHFRAGNVIGPYSKLDMVRR
ncbi:MAG: glucose-1-phosphate thymidylyltransferase [Candidatus Hydrothermarchaeota archaeon]